MGEQLYVLRVFFSVQCMYFKSLILCRWFLLSSCEGQAFMSVCVLNVGVCMHIFPAVSNCDNPIVGCAITVKTEFVVKKKKKKGFV